MSVKLSKDEATAVVATDDSVEPLGYGLGRHGWISFAVDADAGEERWEIIREWVRTSYALVAPKSLARIVLEEDERSSNS
jgi:predicted DNA-binding protein (MmcQ/YjbR family)